MVGVVCVSVMVGLVGAVFVIIVVVIRNTDGEVSCFAHFFHLNFKPKYFLLVIIMTEFIIKILQNLLYI